MHTYHLRSWVTTQALTHAVGGLIAPLATQVAKRTARDQIAQNPEAMTATISVRTPNIG